jgi:hypothetical protein
LLLNAGVCYYLHNAVQEYFKAENCENTGAGRGKAKPAIKNTLIVNLAENGYTC